MPGITHSTVGADCIRPPQRTEATSACARSVGANCVRPQWHWKDQAASAVYALIQSFKTVFLMHGAVCKFEPSCSCYARDAIKTLPPHVAAVKIIWRVLRCNPLSKGGYDPV